MRTENLGIFKGLSKSSADKFFFLSLVGFTLFHLIILLTNSLDLTSDEAIYWEYSKHLNWSYYAKGPGMGVATWISTKIFGDTIFAVRSISLFCFTVFSATFYYFVRYLHTPATALAAFIFLRVTLMFIYTGFISTTDPVVIPFWLASLVCAYLAVSKDSPKFWTLALPLVGFAVLAKYTAAILLVGYGGVILFHRSLRRHLIHPAFWIGVILFAVSVSPIFIWNAQHNWVNFQHNLGHTVGKSHHALFKHLPILIAGQIGLIGPYFFPLLCLSIWSGLKNWRRQADPVLGLWLAVTLPLLLVCLAVSVVRSCYANWPLPAYIGGLLLVIHEFKNLNREKWFKKAIIVNAAITFPLQIVWFLPLVLPDSIPLPTPIRRMVNWHTLSERVESFLRENQANGQMPFVYTTEYMIASSLRFDTSKDVEIRLGSYNGRRLAEQDFWQNWDKLIGRDALVVQKEEADAVSRLVPAWFQECHPAELKNLPPRTRLARDFQFLLCKGYTGKVPAISGAW